MKPRDYASAGRVRLKAHPVPQPKPRDPSRGPHAADPSSTCRQERAGGSKEAHPPQSGGLTQRDALRAVELPPDSGRRGGAAKPAGWPNGLSQVAAGAGLRIKRTPQPSRVVVRLHRTTDPPRAHLWAMFLCEQKGGSAGGSPAKRLTSLATAIRRTRRQARETLDPSAECQQEKRAKSWRHPTAGLTRLSAF